jgi:hypothetical protein
MFGLGFFEIFILLVILFLLIGVPATIIGIIILVTRTANRRADEDRKRE